MVRTIAVTILLALSAAVTSQEPVASAAATGLTAELTAIEEALVKAWVERDEKAVDRVLAEEWTVIDLTGHVLTKAEVLRQGFASQERRIESGAIDEIKVRPLGDVAILTGRSVLTGAYRGERATVTQRFTDVFARRSGSWEIVASQGTRVSP